MRNHDVLEFQILGVEGVKEETHSRNSRYVKSWKDLDRRIIKIVDNWSESISEFQIPGVGGVKSWDSSSQESRSCEMQNNNHFKVCDLECQDTSPQECRNAKSWKHFMDEHLVTTVGMWRKDLASCNAPFRDWELEESEWLTRNLRNVKPWFNLSHWSRERVDHWSSSISEFRWSQHGE